jgi:ComF family protein
MAVFNLNRLVKSILNLWFKPNCVLCDRPAKDIICEYCQRQLQQCQLANPDKFWLQEVPSLFVWGAYQGTVKRAIAQMKLSQGQNCPELSKPLGQWLGESWLKSPLSAGKKFTVVPIPSDPQRLKERGFNQAELLARSFCDITGYPCQSQGLTRSRPTKALYGLSIEQRKQELNQAMRLGAAFRDRPPQNPVLLVDDIYTTGTTCREAQRVLQQHKIPVYGIVAIATTKK